MQMRRAALRRQYSSMDPTGVLPLYTSHALAARRVHLNRNHYFLAPFHLLYMPSGRHAISHFGASPMMDASYLANSVHVHRPPIFIRAPPGLPVSWSLRRNITHAQSHCALATLSSYVLTTTTSFVLGTALSCIYANTHHSCSSRTNCK